MHRVPALWGPLLSEGPQEHRHLLGELHCEGEGAAWMFGEQRSWQRGLLVRMIAVMGEELGGSEDSEVTPGCMSVTGPWRDLGLMEGQKPWGWGWGCLEERRDRWQGAQSSSSASTGAVGMIRGQVVTGWDLRMKRTESAGRPTDSVEREQRGGACPCLRPEQPGG